MWLPLFLILISADKLIVSSSNPRMIDTNVDSTQLMTQMMLVLQKISRTPCTEHLLALGIGYQNGDMWALKMLDASAKPQSGILMGNTMQIGNYDECLLINKDDPQQRVHGKYCTALVQPHPEYGQILTEFLGPLTNTFERNDDEKDITEKVRLSYGFCIPKVCTAEILQNVTNALENSLESPFHFVFLDDYCDDGGVKLTNSAISGIVVFAIFGIILICGTLYDVLVYRKLSEAEKRPNLLLAFSMYTNAEKIFSTTTTEGNLKCLNGLRVISLMWIILAHGYQGIFFIPHINSIQILEWKNATENSFVAGSSMAVDTFFVVSGLLVVYLFLKSAAKGVKLNILMFYVHRLLRLTPSLAMLVLFTGTLLKYMGNGPFWPVVYEKYQKPCETDWWVTLTYLQNYIGPNDQCVGHAWYLAVDTQMYFLSPLILYPLLRWPRQIIGAIVVFLVLNCSYVFEITWKKHLGTTFFNQGVEQFKFIYSPTHVRCVAYLIGMICGYFVYRTRTDLVVNLKKLHIVSLWLFSFGVMLAIVLGHSPMIAAPEYDVLDSSFFNSLTRVGWSIALSVMILLCVNGYGGPINSFLSNNLFTVLIRLNYSTYLVHLNVLTIVFAQERTSTYFSNVTGFHRFWGDYCFSVAVAFIWTLAFESPIITIEKIIFGKKPSNSKVIKNIEASVAIELSKNNIEGSNAVNKDNKIGGIH